MTKTIAKPRKRAFCGEGHEMVSTREDRSDEWVRDYCAEIGCGYGRCEAPLAEIKVS